MKASLAAVLNALTFSGPSIKLEGDGTQVLHVHPILFEASRTIRVPVAAE